MILFLLRAFGFLLLAVAFAALVVDGSRSIAGGRLLFYSVGDIAAWLGSAGFGAALGGVAGWPAAAQRLVTGALAVPGSVASGALGVLMLYLGRCPAAGVGFSGRRA